MSNVMKENDIANLWEFFEARYGRSFTAQYGPYAKHWLAELQNAKITPLQLKTGMQLCMRSGEAMPPNCPTFIARCRRTGNKAHEYYKKLPSDKVTSPEEALQRLKTLRELIHESKMR